jgi:BirA family transcriptional regulator, biotin operon repressor / biotin---[acetyl-CoA-carboxylase] ligase
MCPSASPKRRAKKREAYLPGPTDRRVDALLALLAENPTIVISGASIAKEIGVKRQTVWTWIETLRKAGVKVKGHPRTGYHIERVPDVLAPQLVSQHLRGTSFGKRILHFFQTESTNDVALRLGEKGEPHGTLILAEKQTAGRGRAGHAWVSEASTGIYVTILLRPPISPVISPVLTIAAGLAAREAVAEQTGLSPDIRWPNDVMLNGKKICGILTEMQAEPGRIHFAALGIGLNVNQTKMPAPIETIATSLRIETGRTHSRLELLARLLRQLDRYYNQFIIEGAAPILRQFAEVSSYAEGKRVRITTEKETFDGTTAGLEPSGILRVRRDDGTLEQILSGNLSEAQ